jgi:membrane protein YdbS with pleckstrin-like domain
MGIADETFTPHPNSKTLYYTYLAIVVLVGFLSWIIPVTAVAFLFLDFVVASIVVISIWALSILVWLFVAYWIGSYYSSISYALTEEEIMVDKGVWWKERNIVPYNRVTNIQIMQGPIARHFGLGKISIQTAGFSGAGSSHVGAAEAVLLGIKNFEEIKDRIIYYVRRRKPVATEAAADVLVSKDVGQQILDELKSIRKALK